MKALTIRQPYAFAVASGAKDVENRTRPTAHRGQVAIHAGAAWHPGAEQDPNIIGTGARFLATPEQWRAVVAVADLYGCHVPSPGCCSSVWADADAGAHWLLRDVRRLDVPVPTRGALGLWTLPDDIAAALTRAAVTA